VGQNLKDRLDSVASAALNKIAKSTGAQIAQVSADDKLPLVRSAVSSIVAELGANLSPSLRPAFERFLTDSINYTLKQDYANTYVTAPTNKSKAKTKVKEDLVTVQPQSRIIGTARASAAIDSLFGTDREASKPLQRQGLIQGQTASNSEGSLGISSANPIANRLTSPKASQQISPQIAPITLNIEEIQAAITLKLKTTLAPELTALKKGLSDLAQNRSVLDQRLALRNEPVRLVETQQQDRAISGANLERMLRASSGSFATIARNIANGRN
jgi:hypothetical protein